MTSYRVLHDFILELEEVIPEVIPSEKKVST
jgi:hypothetical protein